MSNFRQYFQQRKSPEFWIIKWSKEGAWFHSFGIATLNSENSQFHFEYFDQTILRKSRYNITWSHQEISLFFLWKDSASLSASPSPQAKTNFILTTYFDQTILRKSRYRRTWSHQDISLFFLWKDGASLSALASPHAVFSSTTHSKKKFFSSFNKVDLVTSYSIQKKIKVSTEIPMHCEIRSIIVHNVDFLRYLFYIFSIIIWMKCSKISREIDTERG